MNVTLQINGNAVLITDEHAASSYGIPVAIVAGEAYGPKEALPIFGHELSWLHEDAYLTVFCAAREALNAGTISELEMAFCESFAAGNLLS